jgi:hypothetical protein
MEYKPLNLSRNRIEVNVAPADALITDRRGLRYYLEIWIPDGWMSTTYKRLIRLEGSEVPPYTTGGLTIFEGAYFPIETCIDGMLDYLAPEMGNKVMAICEKMTMRYYLKKSIENNGAVIAQETTEPEWAIKSGVNEKEFPDWKESLWTSAGLGGKFLSWSGAEQIASVGGTNPTHVNLRAEIMLENGSVYALDLYTVNEVPEMAVLRFPVGVDMILQASPGLTKSDFSGYTVYVCTSDGIKLTESKTYILSPTYHLHEKIVLFNSSLGGFDTLKLHGRSTEVLSTLQDIYERYPEFSASAEYAEKVVNRTTGERSIQINTGYLGKDGVRYLEDLMLARLISIVTDNGYIPMRVANEGYNSAEDGVYVEGRLISLVYTNPEYNFSRLGKAPATAVQATYWKGIGVAKCVQNANGVFDGTGIYPTLQKYYTETDEPVIPYAIKPNVLGTVGYIAAVPVSYCSLNHTPFLSVEIKKVIDFRKNTCGNDGWGTTPEYKVPAKMYGSLLNQANAQAKAQADWDAHNNQAYANQYGICRPTAWRGNGVPVCLTDANGKYTGVGRYDYIERYYTDDNTVVSPLQRKANTAGTYGYVAPGTNALCSVTPHLNDEMTITAVHKKNNCLGAGMTGAPVFITVDEGVFGSALDKADANAKAVAYANSLDTQAYANEHGTCIPAWKPGLKAEYWTGSGLAEPPTASPTAPANLITTHMPEGRFLMNYDTRINKDFPFTGTGATGECIARFTGQIKFPVSGVVKSVPEVNNGYSIYFNGVLLEDYSWGGYPGDNNMTVVAGEWYDIEIRYWNKGSWRWLRLELWTLANSPVVPEVRWR